MAHGHELKRWDVGRRGCAGWRGIKRGKWDNYNSIINKIYIFKIILFEFKLGMVHVTSLGIT